MNNKDIHCEDCEHFEFGVCDIHGFRYEHDWNCKDSKRKENVNCELK